MTLSNALTLTTGTNSNVLFESTTGTVNVNANMTNGITTGTGSTVTFAGGTSVVFASGTTQNTGSNAALFVESPQVTLSGSSTTLTTGGSKAITIEGFGGAGALTLTDNGTITAAGDVDVWAPGSALVMNGTPAAAITSTGGSINIGLGGSSLPSTTTLNTAYSFAATTSGQSVNIESSGALGVNGALTVNSPTANIISTGGAVTFTAGSTFNGGSGATVNFSGNGVSLTSVTANGENLNITSVGSISTVALNTFTASSGTGWKRYINRDNFYNHRYNRCIF